MEEMLGEGKDFLRRRKYFAYFHNLHILYILYILATLPFFIACIFCVSCIFCILIDMGCVKSRRVFNHCCENDIQRQSGFNTSLYFSTRSFMRRTSIIRRQMVNEHKMTKSNIQTTGLSWYFHFPNI